MSLIGHLVCGRHWDKHIIFKSHKNLQRWVILVSNTPFYRLQVVKVLKSVGQTMLES